MAISEIMHTIHVPLSGSSYERLRQKASSRGMTVEVYAQSVLTGHALTYEEIFAPLRKDAADQGMTPEQLEAHLEETLRQVQTENGEAID